MDIKLNYLEKGKGETLLLLHGNGEDHSYFKAQIAHFSQKYRVIAIDTRGHGGTKRGNALFTLTQFAEDLRCFMDENHISSAHILGFSDGGNIALLFALKYPERVNKLILNGANLKPNGLKPLVLLPVVFGYRMATRFAQKNAKAKKKAELLSLMVNEPQIEEIDLRSLPMHTLVIVGTRDMIREKHSRAIAANIPRAELVLLKGDHFLAKKRPEAFNFSVSKFLEKESDAV